MHVNTGIFAGMALARLPVAVSVGVGVALLLLTFDPSHPTNPSPDPSVKVEELGVIVGNIRLKESCEGYVRWRLCGGVAQK